MCIDLPVCLLKLGFRKTQLPFSDERQLVCEFLVQLRSLGPTSLVFLPDDAEEPEHKRNM